MTLAPIISSISIKLKEIEKNPDFEWALNIAKDIAYLLQWSNEGDFKILNVTRHWDKVSWWFNMVPWVDIPASYHFQMTLPVDFKVYWLQKSWKQRIAWCVNFTENYEDDPSLFFDKNIWVDIIIPNIPNKIQIVLSSWYKLRTLELQWDLSVTQIEILQKWVQNFSWLNQKTIHEILWESFNLKSLNQKFYQWIAKRFTEIVQHMILQWENENEVKHFVNRLIGRIIFIWFLRKKNIINESYWYFDVEWIDADKYYYEKLSPLFFETLNKPIDERNHLDRSTPYLNGWLFEARWIDKKSNLSFLKVFFRDLYSFLSEYNFTTDESTSSFEQVAIDPEMLWRIFENLLAEQVTETWEQARKAKWAFYTPREIVDYMCTNSLKTYLTWSIEKTELKDSDKEKIIKHLFDDSDAQFALYKKNESYDAITKNRWIIISALDSIIILDPACWSWAFPMWMMQAIIRVYERVLTEAKFDPVEIKLGIIERSIFWVDIEPMAVEISRLRVWLSIIVDEANDSSKIKPLPNLDFKFVCANSLIPLTTNKQWSFGVDLSNEDRMQEIRYEYFKTNSKIKKEKLRKEFEEIIWAWKESFDTSEYTKQLRSYHPFDPENSCNFFDPKFMFWVEEWFDLIIWNPPYVSTKWVTDKQKAQFESIYWFSDDLYTHFYFKWILLLKNEWILTYISSNTFWTIQTKKNLRKLFLENKILEIYDTANPFEAAMVDTSVIIIQKEISENYEIIFRDWKKDLLHPIIYKLSSSLYKNSVNNVFFKPFDVNLEIYTKYNKTISELFNMWWSKISTSKNITKNIIELNNYRSSLKPWDVTLLWLITDWWQWLATANNWKFVWVLQWTKDANRVLETRKSKILEFNKKYWLNYSIDWYLEEDIRKLFDDLKEKYWRDIFWQWYIYRIVSFNELADVSKLSDYEKINWIKWISSYVPYDKWDKDGNRWYLPTPYYIDWSENNVHFLRSNSGKKWTWMPVVRNPHLYFRDWFCWSDIHTILIKSRMKSNWVYDVKSMSMFSLISYCPDFFIVCLLNSTFISEYDFSFINNTQTVQINDARQIPIIIPNESQLNIFEKIFNEAYKIQKMKFDWLLSSEVVNSKLLLIQKELDIEVYKLYWINIK